MHVILFNEFPDHAANKVFSSTPKRAANFSFNFDFLNAIIMIPKLGIGIRIQDGLTPQGYLCKYSSEPSYEQASYL
eukprot:2114980-Karenia_brevis.AAC.1